MIRSKEIRALVSLSLFALLALGCGSSTEGAVLVVDAEFDPVIAADDDGRLAESTPGVAQTFTVQNTGRFERFWLVLTQGNSADSGTITITVRPVVGMLPNPSAATSIITPIVVDTTTLPATGVETFTMFDVGNDPGREVTAGEQYAIVVEFTSRVGATDTNPIAWVLSIDGALGDPFAGGAGSEDLGAGYVLNPTMDDYLFRTFVLQSP